MALLLTLLTAVAMVNVVIGDGTKQHFGPDVVKVANFAIDYHNHMSNYPYAFKVMTILSDTAQMYPPARVKYTMTVQVAETVCKNAAKVNLADCSLRNNATTMICHFVVLATPYADFYTPSYLLSDDCS